MILNLNELTLEQSKLKAKLKKNVIADYNALTEQLIDYNRDSLEWLVCNVNSRSTVFSSMLAELESLRLYKPQNKMFHFCKTFCSKITLVNTIQNVI